MLAADSDPTLEMPASVSDPISEMRHARHWAASVARVERADPQTARDPRQFRRSEERAVSAIRE
jgi:hypothetical protein